MFRHRGNRRSYTHNLRLASLLSFVAGMVNITGLLSINILTTNLTGHFAYFSESFVHQNFAHASHFLLFILSFMLGAFICGLISEALSRNKQNLLYVVPILIEIAALLIIAFFGIQNNIFNTRFIACTLLFAMGLQNSLVTRVSQSVVRTTHLTGIFTDLGNEISLLFFNHESKEKREIKRGIYLKVAVISCFFLGGILGGLAYTFMELKVLIIACGILVIALLYDYILLKYYTVKRKVLHSHVK
ncbi:YoaK family protein [Flavobacterium rhizosphaerae]|uniref:YoaK family protein n=1 Tax=Flavobacterium rhizosphaerae TaxID=3163298 RepID=A0ABW8YUF3_9FLAO